MIWHYIKARWAQDKNPAPHYVKSEMALYKDSINNLVMIPFMHVRLTRGVSSAYTMYVQSRYSAYNVGMFKKPVWQARAR